MSLDVYLYLEIDEVDDTEGTGDCVYWRNITHNVNRMAMQTSLEDKSKSLYYACWRPEEINCYKAKDIIPILENGLKDLKEKPDFYKEFNPSNGWGSYEGLINFVQAYLEACLDFPEAIIEISR